MYRQGNLLFTPDGTCVVSPVGNRVSVFDLVNNKSFTFAYEHRRNIARIELNPQATLLMSVDTDGRAILVNFARRTVLHHFNFKDSVRDLKFSPDGTHFAVAAGRHIQVWRTPTKTDDRMFAPFVRHRIYTGHYADVTAVTWSADSRFFLTASKDLTARIYSLSSEDSVAAATLSGHRDTVVGSYFSDDQETIYTVSKDGALFQWQYVSRAEKMRKLLGDEAVAEQEENGEDEQGLAWRIVAKHYFNQGAHVQCCAFHGPTNLLVVGFASGVFGLYEMPTFTNIQSLSISQHEVDFVTINSTGEWLAFGAGKLGQLLVWEWQSETYVLKQQGHFDALNALVYSPDGSKIVTAADDGKIKVWDAVSGFAIVTFTEHQAAVTALQFSKRGNVLFSASLDGSVRAWDLLRYRNFRVFTAAKRVQFTSLAVDPSGEIIAAGGLDEFDIHLWSVQTSQLLDRLPGHEGPVSSLAFDGEGGTLASGSWDKTVRVWNVFGRSTQVEPLQQQSDVMAVAFRPDSKQIAVSTLDGQLSFWDPQEGKQVGVVDGRRDISGGRHAADRFSADSSQRSKHFTTLSYNADGTTVIAGGNSKHICMYDVANEVLLRKFVVSRNMDLDGTLDKLNSKNMTEAGPMDLIDQAGEESDLENRIDRSLPGAQRGDASVRKVRPAIRATGIQYSPTGRSFAAATTEGLLIYSVDELVAFDPYDLDIDITVGATLERLEERDFMVALVMAFRLGETSLIQRVYESIPVGDIELMARDLPVVYLLRILRFITTHAESSPHVEYNLLWIKALITHHGRYIMENRHQYLSVLRAALKFVNKFNSDVNRTTAQNYYSLQYLIPAESEEGPIKPEDILAIAEDEGEAEDIDVDSDSEDGWFGPESKTNAVTASSSAESVNSDDSDDEMQN